MDNFCIQRGTLLDEPSTTTLLNPERHSLHWYVRDKETLIYIPSLIQRTDPPPFSTCSLIDVRACYSSNFELLAEPSGGSSLYSRAFQLTDDGKEGIIELAASVGAPNPSDAFRCSECTGEMGSLGRGFRAQVHGIVTETSQGETPATIHVVDAVATHDRQGSTFCTGPFPSEQNPQFGEPMDFLLAPEPSEPPTTPAPVPSPTEEPTVSPTTSPTRSPTTEAPVVTPTEVPTTTPPAVSPTNSPVAPPTGAPMGSTTDPVPSPTEAPTVAPDPIPAPTEAPVATEDNAEVDVGEESSTVIDDGEESSSIRTLMTASNWLVVGIACCISSFI